MNEENGEKDIKNILFFESRERERETKNFLKTEVFNFNFFPKEL